VASELRTDSAAKTTVPSPAQAGERPVLEHNLVLKRDELFLAGDITHADEPATGLYLRDTRHLDAFETSLGGQPILTLAVHELGAGDAVVHAGNSLIEQDGERLSPLCLGIQERISLTDRLSVGIAIQNHTLDPIRLPLAISWSADFRDLFDIRGFRRTRRGVIQTPRRLPDGVELAYRGLDGRTVATRVTWDRPAEVAITPPGAYGEPEEAVHLPGLEPGEGTVPLQSPGAVATVFDVEVPPGAAWSLRVEIQPIPAGDRPVTSRSTIGDDAMFAAASFSTDNDGLNRVLARSDGDLRLLQTTFPEGALPAAGVPWFVAPFGRDSLIVGLQTLHLAPDLAAGILRVLAAHQGTRIDEWREEEPGRILHEVRYGEMARTGEIPHTPYFGTVDATPLFVLLFAETIAWTDDRALYDELLPHVRRALEWIAGPGDPDGDGLVEYVGRDTGGHRILHQGWKDSGDSLHHQDGRPVAAGPIALVEVQGYVFAAYRRLADVADRYGDGAWAAELRQRAELVRSAVEDRFWIESADSYAQALDGEKVPVGAVSSNAGHLLFCGLPSSARAARLAARLMRADLFSGWGIRTLSSDEAVYNPMSYHNGSVWPHDSSLIAFGLRRAGHAGGALAISGGLVAAALYDPHGRLPELFCGYPRVVGADHGPVPYPVSCCPQAWAAAAPPLLLRAMLGLEPDEDGAGLIVDPALPAWLSEISAHGIAIRGRRVSFTLRRRGETYDLLTGGPVRLRGR
jgi:glycogen debranching enzyme